MGTLIISSTNMLLTGKLCILLTTVKGVTSCAFDAQRDRRA